MAKRKFTAQQVTEAIGRLCDRFKLPRNKAGQQKAFRLAVKNGLVRVPTGRRVGRPKKAGISSADRDYYKKLLDGKATKNEIDNRRVETAVGDMSASNHRKRRFEATELDIFDSVWK
jgi:hypothetical protein